MEIKYYLQEGIQETKTSEVPEDKFKIIQIPSIHGMEYVYNGDNIIFEVDKALVSLYDKFGNIYFPDTATYCKQMYSIPIFVQDAGQSSDCGISTELFNKMIDNSHTILGDNLFKHLYLVDCQYLIGSIQNHVIEMNDYFIRYYIDLSLCSVGPYDENYEGVFFHVSTSSRVLSSLVETYFIRAYSILDLLIKIVYEIKNPITTFNKYVKLVSNEKIWGDRKKLVFNDVKDTLFEECELVKVVESLRNEIVHNGTWELNPKIFIVNTNKKIKEKYMLFPDFEQGRLACVKNRKHFFSKGQKINDIFPKIHLEFMNRLLKTIEVLKAL
ncbi:MAG: hypothetical protein IJX91_00245 [Clostridia bacterium]|nr:hypothetical protein [Clostridia bacterium]